MNMDQVIITTNIAVDLPYLLVDYLADLAMQQQAAGIHTFLLTSAKVGNKKVQDIRHYSDSQPYGTHHRLFGFRPVDCQVNIIVEEDSMIISFDALTAA